MIGVVVGRDSAGDVLADGVLAGDGQMLRHASGAVDPGRVCPLGPDAPGCWCALRSRREENRDLPVLVWQAGPGWRMVSSGVVGGGMGPRQWWLNAHVPLAYARQDLGRHVGQVADSLGLEGTGVGMLTAADVTRWQLGIEAGVRVLATVGLGVPVPAAVPDEQIARETAHRRVGETAHRVGTINVLVVLPVPMTDAAMVNAVVTVTEAKSQALFEAGVPGTGTASDSVCIACPEPGVRQAGPQPGSEPGPRPGSWPEFVPEPFCGPRSPWGARLARAAHAAFTSGTIDWLGRHGSGA